MTACAMDTAVSRSYFSAFDTVGGGSSWKGSRHATIALDCFSQLLLLPCVRSQWSTSIGFPPLSGLRRGFELHQTYEKPVVRR